MCRGFESLLRYQFSPANTVCCTWMACSMRIAGAFVAGWEGCGPARSRRGLHRRIDNRCMPRLSAVFIPGSGYAKVSFPTAKAPVATFENSWKRRLPTRHRTLHTPCLDLTRSSAGLRRMASIDPGFVAGGPGCKFDWAPRHGCGRRGSSPDCRRGAPMVTGAWRCEHLCVAICGAARARLQRPLRAR